MSRAIPVSLEEHFGLSETTYTFFGIVTPRFGSPEGFTAHDRAHTIDGVLYDCAAGLGPGAISTQFDLEVEGAEATLLFQGALSRQKITVGHYAGASFRFFAANYRGDLTEQVDLLGGRLGKCQWDDSAARFELLPWGALANTTTGRVTTRRCDCPRFGRGRCAGPTYLTAPSGNSSITGTVKTSHGFGLSGMILTLKQGDNIIGATTTASGTGQYSFASVPVGTYTVAPSHSNSALRFTPASLTVAVPVIYNVDFIAYVEGQPVPPNAPPTASAPTPATGVGGINIADYTYSGAVVGVTSAVEFTLSGIEKNGAPLASGLADYGILRFAAGESGGANAGAEIEIKTWNADGTVRLAVPAPYRPGVGDAVFLEEGCDRSFETCRDRFGNEINFQGFDMPGQEKLVEKYGA